MACLPLSELKNGSVFETKNRVEPGSEAVANEEVMSATSDRWLELLRMTPYPFMADLPPPIGTVLDGTYVRVDPRPEERAGCRRCPPYPPLGGLWKLRLEEGVFRVYHDGTGWRSLGSYVVEGKQVTFFNDPQCIDAYGTYAWEMTGGEIELQLVEDECGMDLRARNLTGQIWKSCQPPNTEAAVSDHWVKPLGCGREE